MPDPWPCPYCSTLYVDMDFKGHLRQSPLCAKASLNDPAQTRIETLLRLVAESQGIQPYAKSTGFSLPGHGSQYPDCGEVKALGCDNLGSHPEGKVFVRLYKRSCLRKTCPVCFEGWASAEAERSLVRLATFLYGPEYVLDIQSHVREETVGLRSEEYHRMFVTLLENAVSRPSGSRARSGRPIHVVISPPQDEPFNKRNYRRYRSEAYKIGKECGLKGGNLIPHPYRLKCKSCGGLIPDYNRVCECSGKAFVWDIGPHFHCVGFGWIEHVKEAYERHGWVVKNLGIRKSVFWTLQYILSHAGIFTDPESGYERVSFHVVTWFGDLAYNKMVAVPEMPVPRPACAYCWHELRPFQWVGSLDRPPPDFDEERKECNEFLASPSDWLPVGM